MKNNVKPVLFSLIFIILFFILLEAVLYLLNIGTPQKVQKFGLRWNFQWEVGNGPFRDLFIEDRFAGYRLKPLGLYNSTHLNSLGFRDDELRENTHLKVLSLGDSTTFGWELENSFEKKPNPF